MSCYVVCVLRDVGLNADIVEYLRTIDDTLTPYDGRFVVHGTRAEVLEGEWDADLVVIEFPDADRARGWYGSAAYRPLIPLRTRNSTGSVLLVEGCAPGYRATEFLAKVTGAA